MSQYEFGLDKEADWGFYTVAHSFQSEHIIDISYSSKLDETKEKAWVAFLPLYFVAFSQGVAAASWAYLIAENGIF